jgi:hypothetical protein
MLIKGLFEWYMFEAKHAISAATSYKSSEQNDLT